MLWGLVVGGWCLQGGFWCFAPSRGGLSRADAEPRGKYSNRCRRTQLATVPRAKWFGRIRVAGPPGRIRTDDEPGVADGGPGRTFLTRGLGKSRLSDRIRGYPVPGRVPRSEKRQAFVGAHG